VLVASVFLSCKMKSSSTSSNERFPVGPIKFLIGVPLIYPVKGGL
jgi:hypothetical protein